MQFENGSLHYNHDLEAKLVQVMNTKVVPCDIISMFKVLLGSHKHFTHWSHVNPSLGISLRGITCDISKVVKIEFDMLMLNDACAHAMSIPKACLIPGCYMCWIPLGLRCWLNLVEVQQPPKEFVGGGHEPTLVEVGERHHIAIERWRWILDAG